MSEMSYEDIRQLWERETEEQDLQNLDDLKVGRMTKFLAEARLMLTEVPAGDRIYAELLTREIKSVETMLRDLLLLRREKIIRAALTHRRPLGGMTLSEEDLYNRLTRALEEFDEYLNGVLSGQSIAESAEKQGAGEDEGPIEYVIVRFVKPIETPFVGIDERTYGPFKAEDVATIPRENVQLWLRDGTVVRVVIESKKDAD